MDIPTQAWHTKKKYEKDDIVQVENLAFPPERFQRTDENGDLVQPLSNEEYEPILTDEENVISADLLGEVELSRSEETAIGSYFFVDKNLSYSANCMVRKVDQGTLTIDEYKTYLTRNSGGLVDVNNSIGVGVAVIFQDDSGEELEVSDSRSNHRLMAGSELNNEEYYNVAIDIDSSSIPEGAVGGYLKIFVYGHKSGSFIFKNPFVSNLGRFFYCTRDHESEDFNAPNSKNGSGYWTQDFLWRPSYGSKSDFVAINDQLKMGEGKDYVTNMAINSLPLELSLNFNNRTDKEARAIVHFLQEKSFSYESIFSLDYKGDRLLSSEIASFNFKYTYPYKEDLKYTCTDFNHSIVYRNNNKINAKFICNTESSLSSVESHAGYNSRIDALIPVFIDEKTDFVKGQPIKLNTFSTENENAKKIEPSNVEGITKYSEPGSSEISGGRVRFVNPENFQRGDCIYINVKNPTDSIFNVRKTKIIEKVSDTEFIFSPVLSEGSYEDVANLRATSSAGEETSVQWFQEKEADQLEILGDEIETINPADQVWSVRAGDQISPRGETASLEYGAQYFEESGENNITIRGENFVFYNNISIKKLSGCPEDCSFNKVALPAGVEKIKSAVRDPATGEIRKRQVYLKNYRRLQIDSDIDADTTTIQFTPMENFTLDAEDDFWLLISAVQGRSSIYLKDPDETPKYPWLEVRSFDQKPSLAFNIKHTPDNIQSNFVKYYNKKYKKELNSNLSTFNVVFDKRSDQEAAEILQFLESHLGYKKFRFNMPRPYLMDSNPITSPTKPLSSNFYCPSWGHDVVYKNNHTISATFIESTSSIEEDLRSVFGIGERAEDRPCYGAEIHNPITKHELCTFSSVLQASKGIGFDIGANNSLSGKSKAVDLVFIVDTTGSMTNQYLKVEGETLSKYTMAIDVILKMITAHDGYVMPGTKSFGGVYDAPELSYGSISGDDSMPPWPAGNQILNSLIGKLYDPLRELGDLLSDNGYNLQNLDRFKIKIDEKRINLGFILMADTRQVIQDVSDYPNSFDKVQSYKSIDIKDTNDPLLEDSPRAISQALAQFYNSPRAEHVTDRIVIMLSDGVFTTADATMPLKGASHDYNEFYSQYALDMCAQLRKGGELAKRRPDDATLKKYGYQSQNPYEKLEAYKTKENNAGSSRYNNPDLGGQNPSWYEEELPTVFMFAQIGVDGQLSKYATNYVYDYDGQEPYLDPPEKKPQFFFPITQEGDPGGEVARMMDLIKVVELVTNDSGYENLFSIVLYNCGPHDVKLLNTLINVGEQNNPVKWTTEILKQGIVKGGSNKDIKYTKSTQSKDSIVKGFGGQYFGDLSNQQLLSDEPDNSNILWESFNTKYEVIREGVATNINGGWSGNSSQSLGVKNAGVAFKGSPVRVFRANSGLEIVDYNIGNITRANKFQGDYSHLPIIKPGEKLDLFFGVRVGKLSDFSEEIQLVVNSDDGTFKGMDGYANYEFNINAPASNVAALSEPVPQKNEKVVGYGAHLSNLPLGGSNDGKSIEQGQAEIVKLVLDDGNVGADSTTRSFIPVFSSQEYIKDNLYKEPSQISFLTSSSITDGNNIRKMFTSSAAIGRNSFYQEVRSLCAKQNVTIEVFSGTNFSGNILFQKTGPFLLYHKASLKPLLDDYLMGFGISEVDIISVDMDGWLNGSIRITE
jgi:phage-related protein